jgi:hypothetical protein
VGRLGKGKKVVYKVIFKQLENIFMTGPRVAELCGFI